MTASTTAYSAIVWPPSRSRTLAYEALEVRVRLDHHARITVGSERSAPSPVRGIRLATALVGRGDGAREGRRTPQRARAALRDAGGGIRTRNPFRAVVFETTAYPIPPLRLRADHRKAVTRREAAADSGTLAHRMAKRTIGILTGGGDCPGLNAVIRAVTRRSLDRGYEVVGVLHGWRGMIEGAFRPLDAQSISGILPRGGTILRTSRTNPYKVDGGLDARPPPPEGARRARRDRRRGHARRRRTAARRGGRPGRRRAEDDRQRPLGDRLHLRVRHRRRDRDRGDRPPAHDRGEPRPRHGRRGHGPPRGLDRRALRHRRRRRRDPDPRAARRRSSAAAT